MASYSDTGTNPRNPFSPGTIREFLTRRREESRFGVTDFVTYLYLIAGAIVMFGPVLWLVMSSFKDESLINSPDPTFLPYRQEFVTFDGYNRQLPSNIEVPEPTSPWGKVGLEGYSSKILLYDVTFKDSYLGDAKVEIPDIQASNGVVHEIDRVRVPEALQDQLRAIGNTQPDVGIDIMGPPEPVESGNLLEIVQGQPSTVVMGQLLGASSLTDLLTGDKRYTVLAPSDTAFVAFADTYGPNVLAALLIPENQALLDNLVKAHILTQRYLLANIYREPDQAFFTLYYPPLEERTRMNVFELAIPQPEAITHTLKPSKTVRLGQVGSPVGASRTMLDPNDPYGDFIEVRSLNTATGELSVDLDPVRQLYFSTENYTEGIEAFDFWTYFRNSAVVTVVATLVTLLINSMAAYGLSKYKFMGRDLIFVIIISTLMVPVSVILIPAFLVISEVGWVNNLWGLIIPGAATPTGVFLLRQYMLTIPDELLDAARIDGASEWRIFWQVILPLARPALAVLAIFSVMWRWNDFLWPLVVVSRNELFTLPVGLNAFQGALDIQWHFILAMTVLTLLPITIVFAFLQQYITSGIATTGMK